MALRWNAMDGEEAALALTEPAHRKARGHGWVGKSESLLYK